MFAPGSRDLEDQRIQRMGSGGRGSGKGVLRDRVLAVGAASAGSKESGVELR